MRISFRNQEARLAAYLPELKRSQFSYEGLTGLPERMIRSLIPGFGSSFDLQTCNLNFLFQYDIFTHEILKFFGEWQLHDRAMMAVDVIVQQTQIPPFSAGIKLIFGSRIISVYRSSSSA